MQAPDWEPIYEEMQQLFKGKKGRSLLNCCASSKRSGKYAQEASSSRAVSDSALSPAGGAAQQTSGAKTGNTTAAAAAAGAAKQATRDPAADRKEVRENVRRMAANLKSNAQRQRGVIRHHLQNVMMTPPEHIDRARPEAARRQQSL